MASRSNIAGKDTGMALLAVMMALIVLSAVATTMAVSIQTESRIARADFDSLQAEQLARSGQEFATYLTASGLTSSTSTILAGVPFEVVVPGFHYQARLEIGTVDIYFEADNGRINPRSAPPELLNNFFAMWSGDVVKGQTVTDSIADWSDPDDDVRPNGAEAAFYSSLRVAPRNASLGVADLPFIRGLSPSDFRPRLRRSQQQEPAVLQAIDSFLSDAATDNAININFAPEFVLQSIPGLSASQVASIVRLRRERPFADMNAVQVRTGLSPESPAWPLLTVTPSSPAVLTLVRMTGSGLLRSERRVKYRFTAFNFLSGSYEPKTTVGRIERNVFPDF